MKEDNKLVRQVYDAGEKSRLTFAPKQDLLAVQLKPKLYL